ncbi:MAG: ABC transporter permease [bacterium]|nr:ABC transporter permease [bacterium]
MKLSMTRIGAIARKEFLHLRRDPLTGGMIAGIPVIMTLLFGFAINQDVRHLHAGLADLANTQASRMLAADVVATQVVDIVERRATAAELEELLVRGRISVGLVIPADFERRAARGGRPVAQLMVDGGDPIVLGAARGLAAMPLPGTTTSRAAESFAVRAYFNPERRSAIHIVPGLCGVILTLTMTLFTSIAIVRERERGNLELLITTPIQTVELMIGKIAPYVLIGYIQVTLILSLGALLFQVPLRGTILDLVVGAGVFVGATLTLGLFISTVAITQFQAFQLTFVTFLPQMLLSGFMFPFDGMPRAAQLLAEAFPLTHFVRIVRGIVLRGANLEQLTPELWPLGLFFVVAMNLAMLRFRKRLD